MPNTIDVHDLPKEQVNLVQELVRFLRGKLETREYEKDKKQKITVRSVKAETFLKCAGLVSVGGDAVKEAEYYDE